MTDKHDVLNDVWVPENITTASNQEPFVEREWVGSQQQANITDGTSIMTEALKFSKDSKWREFQGKQYLNCDAYTDEEMEVVANWDSATKEQRTAFCDKYGFNSTPGLYTKCVLLNLHVCVRLSDVDRTVEWRTVKASSLDAAIKVAEKMPDVEVCLEASFIRGGVMT